MCVKIAMLLYPMLRSNALLVTLLCNAVSLLYSVTNNVMCRFLFFLIQLLLFCYQMLHYSAHSSYNILAINKVSLNWKKDC